MKIANCNEYKLQVHVVFHTVSLPLPSPVTIYDH